MARVLVLSFSDHARDPRVDRQITALSRRHEVVSAGLGAGAAPVERFVDLRLRSSPAAERANQAAGLQRILSRRFEAAYWGNRLVRASAERVSNVRPDVVVAHDIHTLPLALRAAAGAPVLFDAHEYYPEHFVQVRWWRLVMAPYMTYLCRRYMPMAAAAITVSPGLAKLYLSRLGSEPEVIMNAPARSDLRPTAVDRPVRLLHHGSADPRRRPERMIEAVRLLDDRFVLDLMLIGTGRAVGRLHAAARGDSRIRFLEPVPMREIPRVTNSYDVGLFLLEPRTPNQLHVLPNKLFEFIQARLAVAIGPSPDMAAVVREWECGVVADDFTPAAFAAALASLDPEDIVRMKRRSHIAADELCAERSEQRLLGLIDGLLT
jgi:glycosyltransferase involved in cell wall biosynthesis